MLKLGKIREDDGYFEIPVIFEGDLPPAYLIRAVKTHDGTYTAVVRETQTAGVGGVVAYGQIYSNPQIALEEGLRRLRAYLILKILDLEQAKIPTIIEK